MSEFPRKLNSMADFLTQCLLVKENFQKVCWLDSGLAKKGKLLSDGWVIQEVWLTEPSHRVVRVHSVSKSSK